MENWWFLLFPDSACFVVGVNSYEALEVAKALGIASNKKGCEALKLTMCVEDNKAIGYEPPEWVKGRSLYWQRWGGRIKRLFVVGHGRTMRRLLLEQLFCSVEILREIRGEWPSSQLQVGDRVQIKKEAWKKAFPHLPYAGLDHQISSIQDGSYYETSRRLRHFWWKRDELELMGCSQAIRGLSM